MTALSDVEAGTLDAPHQRLFGRIGGPLPLVALTIDTAVVLLAGLAAVLGRQSTHLFADDGGDLASNLVVVGPLAAVGWLLLIYLTGGYRADVFGAGTDEYKRVLLATIYAAGLLGIGCYLTRFPLSRGFYFLLFALGLPTLLLARLMLRRAIHSARRRGGLRQRVLIAGSPAHVDEITAILSRQPWMGYHVIGALTPPTHLDEETPAGVPVIGNVDDVAMAVEHGVDVLFFAGGTNTSAKQMRRVTWQLEHDSIQVVVAPSLTDISRGRIRLRPIGGLPLVHIDPPTWHDASRLGKRSFDVLGSLIFLILGAPLLAGSALWVKLHDRGPVTFRQRRIGRDGQSFDCLKLRSMGQDAEERLADLHESSGHENGLFKLKDDPRITRPGRLLRRFSIDELPQLVNVLRGEMSLVGPRPPLPSEVRDYDEDMVRRLHVRPGMTGLWQVSGRADLSFDEAIRLDLYYVDNWSMLQDISILFRTLGAVLRSRGAY
ncbi:sugar transferase [Nocardioides sp.]|uniref:sugar transferase n=1 Tax=Nocardioides sp. TaxID=35761 RepID=UPI003567560B